MCREGNRGIAEGMATAEFGRDIERLSHELMCLIDLGVLSADEDAAFTAVLEDLRTLLVRAGQAEAAMDRCELYRLFRMLTVDLDLAYQRLCFAA